MTRFAVVAIDGNGASLVLGAYRWRWFADCMARAARKVLVNHHADTEISVYIEDAGPRLLGEFVQAVTSDE